jgi:hypothetical protein
MLKLRDSLSASVFPVGVSSRETCEGQNDCLSVANAFQAHHKRQTTIIQLLAKQLLLTGVTNVEISMRIFIVT